MAINFGHLLNALCFSYGLPAPASVPRSRSSPVLGFGGAKIQQVRDKPKEKPKFFMFAPACRPAAVSRASRPCRRAPMLSAGPGSPSSFVLFFRKNALTVQRLGPQCIMPCAVWHGESGRLASRNGLYCIAKWPVLQSNPAAPRPRQPVCKTVSCAHGHGESCNARVRYGSCMRKKHF